MTAMTAHDWWTALDGYCERTDALFWSEPVNALSNGAFLLAAAGSLVLWRRAGSRDWPALVLIGVVAAVGIGSFLFHTFANRWSHIADVLPITLFIYGYFFLAMRRYLARGLWAAGALTAAFALFSIAFTRTWKLHIAALGNDVTNASFGYFPAALALLGVGGLLIASARRSARVPAQADRNRASAGSDVAWPKRRRAAGRALLMAGVLFALSLVLRSIDLALCGLWPLGTHFLWHLVNALVLFVLIQAAIVFKRRAAVPGRSPPGRAL